MELPKFIGGKKPSLFVSIVIGKNWVQAGIWQVEEGKGKLVSAGTTSPWQEGPESFIEATDDSLSSAFSNFPEEPKLENVVFGLPTNWIDGGKVKQDQLSLLKKLCETLDLKPSGFVVTPEAIVFSLKQNEEGANVSFILIGLGEEEIEITLVEGGRITNSTFVSRSITLGEDVTEGITRFGTSTPLPARLVLYNRHVAELNEIRAELSSWEWQASFFLHAPRIEILAPDATLTAVSEAGAIEVADATQFTTPPKIKEEEAAPVDLTISDKEEEDSDWEKQTTGKEEELKMEEELIPVHPEKPERDQRSEKPAPQEPEKNKISFLLGALKIFRVNGGKTKKLTVGLGILATSFSLIFYLFPRAAVTVYLAPQKLEDQIDLAVSNSAGESKIPGRSVTTEISGEKTQATSGTKTVGERASGEINILNNTASPRSFTAGTILTGPNGLKFVLDAPVTVAAESGAPTYKPGEAKAKIKAGDIGAEYNLASGGLFSIANLGTGSFSGRNDTAFTGGSSREVSSVVKGDQEKLEKELTRELEEKALLEISPTLSASELVIPESATSTVSTRSFSAKPGDETETLNLKLTLKAEVTATSKTDLENYIRKSLANRIPQGLVLQSGYISVSFLPARKNEKSADKNFQAQVSALLLPNLDPKDLRSKISGKTVAEAQDVLVTLPGFARTSIRLSPSLPGPLARLPLKPGNIDLEIRPER